jgi:MraZ protein
VGQSGANRGLGAMAGFKGSFKYTVDQKGRINIPAKFRKTSEALETYVITRGLNSCLYVYPTEEWDKIEEKLRTLLRNDPTNLYYLRATLSNAADVQLDRQGRITIPTNLIKMAGLSKEVLVNGALDRMEIWDPDRFAKYIEECDEEYEEVARKILI